MRSDSLAVGGLVVIVAVWFTGGVVAWAVAGGDSVPMIVATAVLLLALLASVGLGVRFRERSDTTYW